jgi:hypothetical protein
VSARARVALPEGKRFAFTILDDTDDSTLENVRPVYDALRELGLRTTKTVWPVACPEGSRLFFAADTLERAEYLAFVHELVDDGGFELAFHGATMESSPRERTEQALDFLRREFGFVPRLHANHGFNRENLYWGPDRFRTPPLRWLLARSGLQGRSRFEGDRRGSPYFWGDLCQRHFDYVRNFTFATLDVLSANPHMPYRLASTPWVQNWFSTTDAPDAAAFKRRVTPAALDALEERGGVCIVSTHLGKGFARDGRLDPEIREILRRIARRDVWLAPASEILDHLREAGAARQLSGGALLRLELRYLASELRARAAD